MRRIFQMNVVEDGYAELYDLRQPEGKQIEIIGPAEEVCKRLLYLLGKEAGEKRQKRTTSGGSQ